MLAVVVGAIHAQAEEFLKMRRHGGPALGVGEVGATPGAGDVVGEEIACNVCPADGVVLGDAGPRQAIEFAGLDGLLHVGPGQGYRHHAEALQKAAGGGEGENSQSLQIGQVVDRLNSAEMAGIPRTGAEPGDALDAGVGLGPYLVQAPMVEQRRYIQAVSAGERKVAAEHGDVHGRGDGIVVRLHGIDGAILHGFE